MLALDVHAAFDGLAWFSAAVTGYLVRRNNAVRFPVEPAKRLNYYAALIFGAAAGAYALGTFNMWLSDRAGFARSIEGAILGAVISVELYKRRTGIAARTGQPFALPLAVAIAIGRIGCYFAGLPDFTYGTPTRLPWGVDFGDGIARHPVQLYESAAMAGFAICYMAALARDNRFWRDNGLYLCLAFYGTQRFVWEFLKPYAPVFGTLTVFHLASLALVIYAAVMLRRPHAIPPVTN